MGLFRNVNLLTSCVMILGLALLVGCGPSGPPLGKVSGTVTLDGEPLAQGSISFEVPGVRTATGKIANGQIVEVTTFETGDGAPVGEATVTISSVEEAEPSAPAPEASTDAPAEDNLMKEYNYITPTKYANPETSGLSATINDGDNTLSFELTSN